MSKSHINYIFECCKTGDCQQMLDALESVDEIGLIDDRQNSLLATAFKLQQWHIAQALIENNYTFSHASKPLLISACQSQSDNTKGLEMAYQLNSNVDLQNKQSRTALMTASLLGHSKKANFLLSKQANIHLQDSDGNTALMDAVQSKNKKLVSSIIHNNPDINQINNNQETALILEMKQKSPVEDIVHQLLKAGSNPELIDSNNKSAWLIAKQKHPKISRIIEVHLNKINQIELPFFPKDFQQDPQEISNVDKSLPSSSEKPNEKITKTPAKSKKLEKTIKSKQTRQDQMEKTKDNDKIAPQLNPKPEVIKPNSIQNLIPSKQSSDKSLKDIKTQAFTYAANKVKKTHQQEWFHAAKIGNLGGLNRMIIRGIDIECLDDKGCTALIRACGHSRRAVVSFLLQQKANIEARSSNGSTALSSSIIGNCHRVAGLLLEKGANPNGQGPSNFNYVTIAAAQWNDGMLSILYRNGADVFICNKKQQNLLHIIALAAQFYSNVSHAKASIRFLLDHGMNINAQDQEGNTALMILCGNHKIKYKVEDRNTASIAHEMIKLGAAAALKNSAGKSALDSCRHHKLLQTKGVIMNALSWDD